MMSASLGLGVATMDSSQLPLSIKDHILITPTSKTKSKTYLDPYFTPNTNSTTISTTFLGFTPNTNSAFISTTFLGLTITTKSTTASTTLTREGLMSPLMTVEAAADKLTVFLMDDIEVSLSVRVSKLGH